MGHSVSEPAIASQSDDNQMFSRRLTDNVRNFDFQLQLGTSKPQSVHCTNIDEEKGILSYRLTGQRKRFELKVDRSSQIEIVNVNDISITGLKKRESGGTWEEAHTYTFKCDDNAKEKLNDWLQKSIKCFDIIAAAAAKQKEIDAAAAAKQKEIDVCKSKCESK